MNRNFLVIILLLNFQFLYAQKFSDLALTPPMGWNSWNCFECDVHEQLIREIADAMVASGMKDAGYEYIVIDDCWQIDRDKDGFIIADPQRFPSGIKALADYVHDKGLKFGLYSCAGRQTCAKRPGSRGHEFQDAIMYARWGVDYLKYDWCNTEGQTAQESYSLMRDALYASGRPVVFSLCEWGLNKPWEWAAEVGHLWRTTGDIRNNWDIPDAKEGKVWAGGVIINLDMQQGLESFAGPGHWNDPDMLQVGNGVLSASENRAHFSLWCMLAAPLMAGNDLRTMLPAVRDLLTNREVIAVNQDSLGKQGYKIRDEGEFEIFCKPLSRGNQAICLFNRHDTEFKVSIDWKTLQIPETCRIRDLWKHEYCGDTGRNFTVTIPAHDVILLKLEKI